MKIKNAKWKLVVTAALILYAATLFILKIPCPIYLITGVKCFGCGMTRALISVVNLDFVSAFDYHKMFWSVPILYAAFLLDGKLFKQKAYNILMYIGLSIGFIANWAGNIL